MMENLPISGEDTTSNEIPDPGYRFFELRFLYFDTDAQQFRETTSIFERDILRYGQAGIYVGELSSIYLEGLCTGPLTH